jgi:histidyl-tRNA synthetase
MADPETGNKKAGKPHKLKARLPRGLADRGPAEIAATRHMVESIRGVFERYGFEPVETPAFEYTDALGKFLPDQDRPNEGVFSFQDDDEQWLSLRYDLTAPLARYVAERIGTEGFVLPCRSYRFGWVFRNEKPGPGRFRQFMQFDADTVGAASMAADAEMCMLAADTMEALGIARGQYVVKVNNRKLLDGILDSIDLDGESNYERRTNALRALDKYDRLGEKGVRELLGEGRLDESGDISKGVGLDDHQIDHLMMLFELNPQSTNNYESLPEWDKSDSAFVDVQLDRHSGRLVRQIYGDYAPGRLPINNQATLDLFHSWIGRSPKIDAALKELSEIATITQSGGYGSKRVMIDPSIVRGLEYYTGPVFEVELLVETNDDKGRPVRFGSVGGGGRYDGLVSRFSGQPVPATGFSIGVSRLQAALNVLGKFDSNAILGPVIMTVMDKGIERLADYQRIVTDLRNAGIRAELYLGSRNSNLQTQLKYADKRSSPIALIQGSNERDQRVVLIRDLILGAEMADPSKDREEYLKKQTEAQFPVKEADLVDAVAKLLARHKLA